MRSVFSFWIHGFKKALKKSWEKYNEALVVFGFLYTIAAVCLSKWVKEEFWGLDVSTWATLAIPALILVGFIAHSLFKAPYEIYKELYQKMEDEKSTSDVNINKLTLELQNVTAKLNSREPLLGMEILSLVWWENDSCTETRLFMQVRIINQGTPSLAKDYSLLALLPNGQKLMGEPMHIASGSIIEAKGIQTRPEPLIYEETIRPIPEGGQAGGWISFTFHVPRNTIRVPETIVSLECCDVRGKHWLVTSSATGSSEEGLKYHPGVGIPPFPDQSRLYIP